jgi:hypothetical protein
MRTAILSSILAFGLLLQSAVAGEVRVIELKDGSTISGEVLSLSKGLYTIKSDSLGTITLEESKVRVIRSRSADKGAGSAAQGNAASSAEVLTLQQKMLSNAEVMNLIQSLQNNPDFKKVLEDPEIMKAVNAGDIAALTANPEFMKLLNNATVKDIQKKTQ